VGLKEPYWIGLSERGAEGKWQWSDKSKPEYFNWQKNQPDDSVMD